jgi:hypothetical protein
MFSFTQYLQDKTSSAQKPDRERRADQRIPLPSARGEVLCQGTRIPCQVLDIGLGGCSVFTDRPFTAGALAHVEILTTLLGQSVHLYGSTEWTRGESRVGVRFTHPSFAIKLQLERLIGALFEQAETEKPAEANIFPVECAAHLQQSQPEKNCPSQAEASSDPLSIEFVRAIHGEAIRALSWKEGEWPVEVRSLNGRLRLTGALVDLSVSGCSVRLGGPYDDEFQIPVEVSFRLQGLPFLLAGSPVSIDDPATVGIHFNPMSYRRKDELIQLVSELRAAGKSQPDALPPASEAPATAPSGAVAETAAGKEILEVSSMEEWEEADEDDQDADFWRELKTANWDL